MMTYYFVEGKTIRFITLNPWEYAEESKTKKLYTDKKEAKKASRKR